MCGTRGDEVAPAPMPPPVHVGFSPSSVPHYSQSSRAKRSIRKASTALTRFFGKKELRTRPPASLVQQTSGSGSQTAAVPAKVAFVHGTSARLDNTPDPAQSFPRDRLNLEDSREEALGLATPPLKLP